MAETDEQPQLLKRVFFRMIPVTKEGGIDTSKCIQVGFVNLGGRPAFLNKVIQIPDFNPSQPIVPFFLPVNEWERDATKYDISFNKAVQGTQLVIVFYKEIYIPDYLREAKRMKVKRQTPQK